MDGPLLLSEDIVKQQNFPLHMLATYAIGQTKSLATKLLSSGMMKGRDPSDIESTVQSLASKDKFFSHGSTIDHIEASRLGLNVRFLNGDDEFWQRIWLLYCMYSHDTTHGGVMTAFRKRRIDFCV
jgi:hypothetical protein